MNPEADTAQIDCPSCGSSAQVKLADLVIRVWGTRRWEPYAARYFCLYCMDYHEEAVDERERG